jgi:hypothetical protein
MEKYSWVDITLGRHAKGHFVLLILFTEVEIKVQRSEVSSSR